MDELDDIFRLSDTDSSGSDDLPRRPKARSKNPGRTRAGSPSVIIVAHEDSEEAVDDLRNRLEDRCEKSQRDLEDLKHEHYEKLGVLKHNNLTQEQERANSYNAEYQNLVWSVTLKHIGCGTFTEDVGTVLQHHLSEEQFKFEKEILQLQQQFDSEIADARRETPDRLRIRRRRRRKLVRTIDPKRMAEIICQGIADAEDALTTDPSMDVIDGLIKILRGESRRLANRRAVSPPHRRQPLRPRSPRQPPPRPEEVGAKANLHKHIKARTKLERTVARADRFVQDLHGQSWFQDLFPHIE
jgi:hypothetical protein